MKAKFILESIEFQRGQDPKETLKIGKRAKPLIISAVDEEYCDDGPIQREEDVPENQEDTWNESLDNYDAEYILSNWEKEIHPYYGFWIQEEGNESFDVTWYHPAELEDEWVKYEDEVYYIPKTNKFTKISDVTESLEFQRGQDPKSALGIGKLEQLRDEYRNLIYVNEIEPILEKIKDNLNELLQKSKYANQPDKILFRGGWPSGTDDTGLGFFEIIFDNRGDHSLYLNSPNGTWGGDWTMIRGHSEGYSVQDFPMGNLYEDNLKTLLDNIIEYYESGKLNESIEFQRGKDPKKSLGIGSRAQNRKWWDKMKNMHPNDADEEIGDRIIQIIRMTGINDIAKKSEGIYSDGWYLELYTNKGLFDFNIDRKNADIELENTGGELLGNLIDSPEDIGINFKKVYDSINHVYDLI